jgi:hypothetical protein
LELGRKIQIKRKYLSIPPTDISGFPPFSFTVYSNRNVEICKRLREFEKIEISRQSCRIARRKTIGDFCPDFVKECGLRHCTTFLHILYYVGAYVALFT